MIPCLRLTSTPPALGRWGDSSFNGGTAWRVSALSLAGTYSLEASLLALPASSASCTSSWRSVLQLTAEPPPTEISRLRCAMIWGAEPHVRPPGPSTLAIPPLGHLAPPPRAWPICPSSRFLGFCTGHHRISMVISGLALRRTAMCFLS